MPPLLRSTLAALLALILISSCAGHGTMSFVDAPAGVGKRQSIFVVTNRKKDETGDVFSGERSTSLSYSNYTVSVPPGHKTGKVEWAEGKPDPKTDFVTVGAAQYPGSAAFKAAINVALAGKTGAEREVMVFVHGYNTSYSEGIYRLAQIKNDFQVPGLAVHFSWPSAADTKYYVYDRDSIALSRDGMQSMLQDLTDTNVSRIILVGHSMGTYLTVETLRQMSMLGDTKFRNKLGPVVLLSPDIDVDVFKSQVSRINPLPQPFILFTSSKDRALKLSAIITGTKDRLGSLSSASEIGDEKITVVDVSKFAGGDKLNHFAVATSPALISLINGVLAAGGGAFLDPAQDINPVDASVSVVSGVTQIILSPLAILEPKR